MPRMSTERNLVCIVCPNGCRLTATLAEGGAVESVVGGVCKRGADYAAQECAAPKRMVATLARIAGRRAPLSVKTSGPIPKEKIKDCLAAIHASAAAAPVRIGDVILADVCGTGVDFVATSNQ